MGRRDMVVEWDERKVLKKFSFKVCLESYTWLIPVVWICLPEEAKKGEGTHVERNSYIARYVRD